MECLSDVLANTFDAVVVCTGEQHVVAQWNAAAERLFGIPTERAIGQPAASLARDPGSPGITPVIRDAIAERSIRARAYEIQRTSGKPVRVEVNAASDLEDATFVIVAREAVGEPGNSFLVDFAHELRTPLTPLLMTAAALRNDERLPADAREQLAVIERNAALQAQAIDRVLEHNAGAKAAVGQTTSDTRPRATREERPQLRLLLVEDHESTLHVLSRLLTRAGHQVVTAGTLSDALSAAKNRSFDLVISDLGLPDGTGHELMEIVRARYGLRGIALSGYGMEEDVRRARQAGFAAHLTKPIDFQQLERALNEVLQSEALQ